MNHKSAAVIGILIAATFALLGGALILTDRSLRIQGIAILAIGIVAIAIACLVGIRGQRLRARIVDSNVVIGGFWADQTIPLDNIIGTEKGIESVVIQTHERRIYVADTFFENDSEMDKFIERINQRINRR